MGDAGEWADQLVGHVVLHVPTGTVGKVTGWRRSKEVLGTAYGDLPRDGEVIVDVEPGHTFWGCREKFLELSPEEMRFHEQCRDTLRFFLGLSAKSAREAGVRQDRGLPLVASVIERQLTALRRGDPT